MKTAPFAVFAGILALSNSYAAIVTWEPAHNISQSSDVLVAGALVGAFNVGGPGVSSTTVNTVVFSPLEVPNDFTTGSTTIGNFTVTGGARMSDNTAFGSASSPFSTFAATDPSYATLLESATAPLGGLSLSLSGLLIDRVYVLQIWINNSRPVSETTTIASVGAQVTLDLNTSNSEGGIGQFATGRFVADSANLGFGWNFGRATLNAFQLRDLGVVPELSTWGILGLGSAVLLGRRKLRRQTLR
jgi:hypothetical protein